MLIECVLAIISVCAVGYIWSEYVPGGIVTPTAVFATGISRMCAKIPFLAGAESVIYSLLILAVSAFCLTSLDTATRLARYMFQEFWLALGMTGYAKIWALFGASNQLLAALGLLAVAAWLGKVGKNNKMLIFPMAFMLIVTVISLLQTIYANVTNAVDMWSWIRAIIGSLLVLLSLVLAKEGCQTLFKKKA